MKPARFPKIGTLVTIADFGGWAKAQATGDLLAARGFNVVGRVGVQNYEQEGGKLTKIEPKAAARQQKNAQASAPR